MKRVLNQQGFTLIELMAASLIGIILMGVVGSIFFTSLNLFSRSEAIQYKEGSITNVETNLQNAVATAAKDGGMRISSSATGSNYAIGFKDGNCVEIIEGHEENPYIITEISEIILNYDSSNRVLSYELVPKENSAMSVLKGGIVVNNTGNDIGSTTITLSADNSSNPQFLVINRQV